MIFGVTWVAVVALAISVANGVVAIVNGIRKRSRFVVTIDHDIHTPSTKPRVHTVFFTVAVQNLGKTTLTVWDVGLLLGQSQQVSLRYFRNHVRYFERKNVSNTNIDMFRISDGPDLPHQIPAGGVADWVFEDSATVGYGDSEYWRGYATRLAGKKKKTKLSHTGINRLGTQRDVQEGARRKVSHQWSS